MEALGFIVLPLNICLFKYKEKDIMVILYVDDILAAAPEDVIIDEFRNQLSNHYKIKDIREVKRFLGLNIVKNEISKIIFLL